MGLSGWLPRQAARRPRVLVVGCPYGTRVRLLVEAEVDRRGWAFALAPAEAGVLVVCGAPGDEMARAVGVVWEEMTSPRVFVPLASGMPRGEVAEALDRAAEVLGDRGPESFPWRPVSPGDGEVVMAGRGPDRDGLKLDRLHVPLGPVLADWPAGLVVETVLQGDVVQEAVVRVLPPGEAGAGFWSGGGSAEAEWRWAAARLDSLGRLLGVAGWPAAAREARGLRDRLLVDRDVGRDHERFARRVRGSWVLRWMLRGVGVVGDGAPEWMRGDALDRAHRWLDATSGAGPPVPSTVLSLLPGLLTGAELAVARLIVASLDPDLERLPAGREVADG